MKPEIIALVSALGGIFIGTIGNIIISFFSKRFEYQKEIKRVIISTATEDWKQAYDFAKQKRGRTSVSPLSSYILFNSMIIDLIGKKDIDEEKLKAALEKQKKINEIVKEYNQNPEETDSTPPNNNPA